ncbi:hypothetical protein M2459_000345 [Parabacteroides sp. PF5-5]|uniref:hypothetical protein n=1 Tax=unclassified Parabacteroides TaxID=2649774 RepID=UPI002476098E|nr:MULTISPECIES: hypothetical protein [unclassified Parabacteroides]MDH6306358.1 hypothetical protein [Parabacteroides sp. PH5-39]MDH6314630.1 hypothetical protein [Parabacteroides sp. PF5-13]MDH6321069.1 hypothetical protein [Parabacteroides sp. PH5-13]MDH6324801.1 hypothetical protein [Parabacteroides sp. PH5-8]MDH6325518.1 hypothetical protein [Parabacteroides sp. PH5-41]
MIYGITLIILGLLAVPSLLLEKKPNAQEWFDKIAPYQGWIGVVFAIWGLWGIISCFLNIGWIGHWPIYWITWLLVSVVEFALGFILGYGLITKYALSKNEQAAEKGEQLLAKLRPWQGKLGIVAIVLGVWQIISSILWKVA